MTAYLKTTPQNIRPSAKHNGSRYVPPAPKTADGQIQGYAVQTIRAEPVALYNFWRKLDFIPRWQENVVSVTSISERISHWVMGDPEDENGKRIEFDSEVIEDVPGSKLSWKSITPGIVQSGTVTFEASPSGRGTLVTLIQSEKLPGGSLSNAAAAVAKRSPRQIVIEDLRHFKQMAEAGEIPSVKGQPHGPRGMSGGIKEWMYGENNATPPGTSSL